MNERATHPFEYLAVFRRRKWWFIVTFVVCAAGGVALALLLPPTYASSATIAVAAPAVSPEMVPARAALDREERIRALSQQLRSPAVLERVAREERLVEDQPMEAVTQDLWGRITVRIPTPIARTDSGPPELNTFEIVYKDGTPERSRRITNRLANVFVDEHSRSREVQAEGTAEFLAAQLRGSQERISTLEERLRVAKERNMGRLPEQTLANLQTLGGMRQQLESAANNLRLEQERLNMLERQAQSMKQGAYVAPLGAGSVLASPQQRVIVLQRDLENARSKYTEKHPEVQMLQEELKAARAEAAMLAKQPQSAREEVLAADPAYQQLMNEIGQTQLRIGALRRTQAQLQADIARYQQRVEAAPMVEQELMSTTRDYELERENFKQLSVRHQAAMVQEQIARTRGGERFSVLYPAYLPSSPESPNRPRIILLALALGVGLGGALAFGREYLDWSVRDARALQDELDVPVLAEIPRIHRAV